jgi:hypothetical protein
VAAVTIVTTEWSKLLKTKKAAVTIVTTADRRRKKA